LAQALAPVVAAAMAGHDLVAARLGARRARQPSTARESRHSRTGAGRPHQSQSVATASGLTTTAFVLAASCCQPLEALKDGLAPLPPMGYNTWNDLACKPTEQKLKKSVQRLHDLGFAKLGYTYVTLDDCWTQKQRDARGRLQPIPRAFPSGMAAISKFIHDRGFKFGMYTDRGVITCAGYPGSLGHEEVDAQTFADWGVDFVKNDGCWDPDCGPKHSLYPGRGGSCPPSGRLKALQKFQRFWTALQKTNRSILHAICGWQPWWAPVGSNFSHMWRIAQDVRRWDDVYETSRVMEQLGQWHGPNGWTDADMLIGSSPGADLRLTPVQARAQFSLWVVMAAPLMLGTSVAQISAYDLETYSNAEAIRINQDPLALPGRVVQSNCPPYPRLKLSVRPDGTPDFTILGGLGEQGVACGAHWAESCTLCPQGHGKDWCNGDCTWEVSGGSTAGKCVQRSTAKKSGLRMEEMPGPFAIQSTRSQAKRECQQVWVKDLQGGELGLAAINWASTRSKLTVPLGKLTPWPDAEILVHDLWRNSTLLEVQKSSSNSEATLTLELPALGGNALLRLRQGVVRTAAVQRREAAATADALLESSASTSGIPEVGSSTITYACMAAALLFFMVMLLRRHCCSKSHRSRRR